VYVGGWFTAAGGSQANHIAKWDGSSWSALGSGMNMYGAVYALAVSGSDLYAGGRFTMAGDTNANLIAKWDGSSWSPLGSGIGGGDGTFEPYVSALAVSGSDLYAGGRFTTAGGANANNIAKWNGSSWSALDSGMGVANPVFGRHPHVNALVVSGTDLYAGGYFTTAGGTNANSVAKWNGSNWSALGSGIGEIGGYAVIALAVSGSNLYAGGIFTSAGGSPANHIAKWDSSSWSALGSGMNMYGAVYALTVSGNDLYAGGSFTNAGGSSANYVAKWDGGRWSALGSGMNGDVQALAVSGSDLYAGGEFMMAGGKFSFFMARAYLELPALSVFRSDGDLTFSWPVFYSGFVLQQSPDVMSSNGWSNADYLFVTNGAIKSTTTAISPGKQFFRLIGN
jgi:hypothetical protein